MPKKSMKKRKRESLKDRFHRMFVKPSWNFISVALYVSAAAAIVGKDGIKSGLSMLACFGILSVSALAMSYIMDNR